jgi:uncharacterized protein YjbI with pentapeptide repeats
MKLNPLGIFPATTYLSANWFSAAFLASFLTIISASAAVPPPSAEELNAAEKWVAERVTAGKEADLSQRFPEEKDRKLSAHFLEDLLTGARPGFKLHRNGVRIAGATIDGPIDLTNAQIPCEVWLEHCQFMSSVIVQGARFAGNISFDNSAFKAVVDFTTMKVGGGASFSHAVFEGPVDFAGGAIARQFTANEAQFKDKGEGADFSLMKVEQFVLFNEAVFEGPVKFQGAKFGQQFNATKAVFEGPVDFARTDIVEDFIAQEAQFRDKEKGASFSTMKVGGGALFKEAVFEGPVDFTQTDIAEFFAHEAQFKDKGKGANFYIMKVGQIALLHKAVFEGPVNFHGADIAGQFTANEAQFRDKEKGADFSGMKVRGSASFRDAVFEGPVDFRYADFAWLDLSSPFWPKVYMQGMSYKYIGVAPGNEPKSHTALLKLANQSPYTADVYSNLEKFFLSQGYLADADKAFIAGKVRERKEYFRSGDWFGWLRSWMLDLLVGYGRQPWRAGISCAVVIALGCVLFSPNKMEPQKPGDTQVYSRFWYSLNLFLPVVDLQAGKVWNPKADQTFLRNYMRVHILLGWILVPLVLAAVTGLIK